MGDIPPSGFDVVEGVVEMKFDAEISICEYFQETTPIKLRRHDDDSVDAGNFSEAPPSLPPKARHIGGASADGLKNKKSAGRVLMQGIQSKPNDEFVHDTSKPESSSSVKAFFGLGTPDAVGNVDDITYEYNMNHKKRGLFVIFNHMKFDKRVKMDPRAGTHVDKQNLEDTARMLGFEYIRSFDDLTEMEIYTWVNKLANADHSKYDCFAMAVLTHGAEGDILYARDGKYPLDRLTEPFMAKNCPSLAGKPKLFFIQACRGTKLDDGFEHGDTVDAKVVNVDNQEEKEVVIIPNAADFLIAYSTTAGYYAWRNQTAGSWFIQALCKCLQNFGDKLELMQIMTRVNRMVAYDFKSCNDRNLRYHGKKQIPSIVTRLTHEVFFRKKGKHVKNSAGSDVTPPANPGLENEVKEVEIRPVIELKQEQNEALVPSSQITSIPAKTEPVMPEQSNPSSNHSTKSSAEIKKMKEIYMQRRIKMHGLKETAV